VLTETSGAPIDYRDPDIVNHGGLLATNGLLHAGVVQALRA
jgi:hypothetical protein